jgi:hypothetical protein
MKPETVTRAERVLGVAAESWKPVAYRGWSRAEHLTIRFADGTRAFAKVASIDPHPGWLRQERDVYGVLSGPFMPAFAGFEDGERPLLLLEDLSEGEHVHWPPPWRPGDVEAVLATIESVAATSAPALPAFPEPLGGWSEVAADPAPFLALDVASGAWLERALPELVAAEERAQLAGEALVHGDLRSDNLCIRDGAAVLVDWNFATRGNGPALDVACWLPSLTLEGGPGPREISRSIPGVDELAVAIAGFFAARAGLPPPEGAPRVRGFQLAQLEVALPWTCEVLGLEPPDR